MSDHSLVVLLTACTILAGIIGLEFSYEGPADLASARSSTRAETKPILQIHAPNVEELAANVLAGSLFSPTRRPPRSEPGTASDSELRDMRLSGIVIEPGHRMAIFVAAGAKPIARSQGEALNEWVIESISPQQVLLSGPTGTRTFEPKPDTALSRPLPPAGSAKQPQPAAASGKTATGISGGTPTQSAATSLARTLPSAPPQPIPAIPSPSRLPSGPFPENPTKRQ